MAELPHTRHSVSAGRQTEPFRARSSKGCRPSLSGVWLADKEAFKYLNNIAADFQPGQFPIQPWAGALTKERMTGAHASEFPLAHCLPQGITILDGSTAVGYPFKIVQEPNVIVLLCEAFSQFRQVFLDGVRCLRTRIPPGWGIRCAGGRGMRWWLKRLDSMA